MSKENVIYVMAYYPALKDKEILPFAITWMSLEDNMPSEISQTEKDKYHVSNAQ